MASAGLPFLYASDTLAGAMLASARSGMELLPVVDEERRLVGVIRRGDLLAHYSDKVLGEQEEAVHVHGEDAVLPVDPGAALREGDVLAAVGTREQFLKVWLLR
jgi:CBS domain-containing protein